MRAGTDRGIRRVQISTSQNWSADIPSQVPPLTPGTNKKMAEALKATFASWEKEQLRLGVPKDPRQWSEAAVAAWLRWAAREFSLEGVALQQFARAQGKDICAMGREEFVARAPAFMGDILWEHLEILQKDVEKERSLLANVPPNMYESNVCLPELPDYVPPPAHHYNNNNNTARPAAEKARRATQGLADEKSKGAACIDSAHRQEPFNELLTRALSKRDSFFSRLRPLDNGVPYPVAVGSTRAQVGIIPSSLVPAFVTLETHPCKKSTVVQQLVSVAGGVTGRHSGRTLAAARANSADSSGGTIRGRPL
ncbi:unnamed protein product [Pieris macdunnoughi]|uniref:PNT domain-containing protein n=1 Tax=Pieris macdunnoughi TaxID=345717 RepID=A0A821VS52_9NEOP|nr:unnamed protein product [Pieris macdunnoughi]